MADVIKIGCSAVLSGHEAIHGRAIVNAVTLAIEQANRHGNQSEILELVVGDDRDEKEAAIEVAQAFINDDGLMGVVGPMNSEAAFAAGECYQRADLAHISPAASNLKLTRMGRRSFFRMVGHDGYQGERAAEFALRYLSANTIGIIHDGSSFGKPLSEVFQKRAVDLGANIVVVKEIRRGQVDFSTLAHDMVAVQPEAIFFGVIEEEGLHLAPQLRRAGVRSVFLGTDGLKASRYLETPEAGVKGPFYSNASTDVSVQTSAQSFGKVFQDRFETPHSVYSAEAYDAAGILIQAILRAAPLNRQSVLEHVLSMTHYNGATGRVAFDHYGDRLNPQIGFYEQIPGAINFLGFDSDLCH